MFKNLTYMIAQDLSFFREANKEIVKGLNSGQIFRVLDYDFTTERQLNAKGVPYNSRVKALLHLTIEINKHDSSVFFYDALSSRSQMPFSLFFCQGTSSGSLKCVNAAVLEGFVIDIKERYHTLEGKVSLKLEVDMLVRSFKFAEEATETKHIPFHLLKFSAD